MICLLYHDIQHSGWCHYDLKHVLIVNALICLPIIYILSVEPVTLAFCVLLSWLFLLPTHMYLHISHSDGGNKGMDWLEAGPEDAVAFFFFFPVLNILYI